MACGQLQDSLLESAQSAGAAEAAREIVIRELQSRLKWDAGPKCSAREEIMGYKNRSRPKGKRQKSDVVAPSVMKLAAAAKKAREGQAKQKIKLTA